MNTASAALRYAGRLIVPALVVGVVGCTREGSQIALPPGVPSNAAQFIAQAQPLTAGITHTRSREATCDGCTVSVLIETLYTTPFDPNSPPSPGAISARLTNLDSLNTETLYQLKPSNQATYYSWVDADPSTNQLRWTLLEVPSDPAGTVRAQHQEPLTICAPNAPGEAIVPEVDFVNFKHPQGCGAGDSSWVRGPAPIWKKCSTGCCY